MGEKTFDKPDDDWFPVLISFTIDGQMIVAGLALDKQDWPTVAKVVAKEHKVVFMAGVLSSWTVDAGVFKSMDEINAYYDSGKRLSDHPQRVEALIVDCADPFHNQTWKANIIRSPDAPPKLGEWEILQGTGQGVLAGLTKDVFAKPVDV